MPGSIINGTVGHEVTLGSSAYSSPLTISHSGYVRAGYTVLYADAANGTVVNLGSIISTSAVGLAIDVEKFAQTIENAGIILGGVGVYAQAGGYVSNSTGGVITGTISGVESQFDTQSLNNAGAISGGKYGIFLNSATFGAVNSSTISGGNFGVKAAGGVLSITNTGKISGGAYDGVEVNAGSLTISNSGTISGGGVGIYSYNSNTTINNLGLIHSANVSVLMNGGTMALANYGTIDGRGISVVNGSARIGNSGVISGNYYSGISLNGSGSTITNAGRITGKNEGIAVGGSNDVIINSGTISGSTFASILGAGTRLIEEAGGVFQGRVIAGGSNDVLELGSSASAGMLDMGTSFSSFPTITFDAGAHWTLAGAESNFNAGQTIGGFAAGDTLVLENVNASLLSLSGAGMLTLSNHDVINFTSADALKHFTVTSVGGNTDITLCYLRGTRILTPRGETRVEDLRIGDEVVACFGGVRRIQFIGRHSYARRLVEKNFDKMPVRITMGALGGGLPRRDLFVSPGHSLLINGILVLARDLVNGVNITQREAPEWIDYFHIDLGTHDCVCAEGSWAESYADAVGMRAAYENHFEFEALYPDYVAPAAPQLCAPRPVDGLQLAAVLRALPARAA